MEFYAVEQHIEGIYFVVKWKEFMVLGLFLKIVIWKVMYLSSFEEFISSETFRKWNVCMSMRISVVNVFQLSPQAILKDENALMLTIVALAVCLGSVFFYNMKPTVSSLLHPLEYFLSGLSSFKPFRVFNKNSLISTLFWRKNHVIGGVRIKGLNANSYQTIQSLICKVKMKTI